MHTNIEEPYLGLTIICCKELCMCSALHYSNAFWFGTYSAFDCFLKYIVWRYSYIEFNFLNINFKAKGLKWKRN